MDLRGLVEAARDVADRAKVHHHRAVHLQFLPERLVKAGVPRYAEIISIADDPGEAAANYFILKLMGYPDVKVLVM